MCLNKSIVNYNCNSVIRMYVITLYCRRDLQSAKGLQDLRLTNMLHNAIHKHLRISVTQNGNHNGGTVFKVWDLISL